MADDLYPYTVEVPSNAIVPVYPPELCTTTTVPADPAIPTNYAADRTVVLQVPSGGGSISLGNAALVVHVIPADDERALDDLGKNLRIHARASAGTVTLRVLVVPG